MKLEKLIMKMALMYGKWVQNYMQIKLSIISKNINANDREFENKTSHQNIMTTQPFTAVYYRPDLDT